MFLKRTLSKKLLDVESLIIRALSLNLVKGSIDEVAEKVHMTWVQPRVLSVEQVDHTTHAYSMQIFFFRSTECVYESATGSRKSARQRKWWKRRLAQFFLTSLFHCLKLLEKIKKRVCVTIYILYSSLSDHCVTADTHVTICNSEQVVFSFKWLLSLVHDGQ